jgi:beta-hydroxylase
MWYEPERFPFMAKLAARWLDIKRELHHLDPERFIIWGQTHMYHPPGGWQICPLYVDIYPELLPFCAENRRHCPVTAELLASIPGMTSGGFSALLPGTRIIPHPGEERDCLRSHLGLVVPEGCGLRFGTETRAWKDGEWLVFDDTFEHDAWNLGSSVRVVLMVDFRRAAHGLADPAPPRP